MPVALCRVDDRLVHGQVVIGWGRPLGVQLIVLVDDGVAASSWEQDLYRMAVPPEIELVVASVADAAARLPAWQADERRIILLSGELATIAELHRADPEVMHRINLGGIHHRPGRVERLPYLYLTDEELQSLQALESAGAEVTAQDLPTSPAVNIRSLT